MNLPADNPPSPARILIVEDESRLARLLADYLEAAGYATHCLEDGREVAGWVKARKPDLVVLDLMLPGRDGLEICKEIRTFSLVPILMATARAEEIDRLLGLELGADDYLCKPYSPREVVARVKAILRRARPDSVMAEVAGPLQLDPDAFKVMAGDRSIELTAVEFQLFATLFQSPGRIFSRARLMDNIYADQRIVSDRTIDSHIKKLRRKLADILPGLELIHSVYGAGYRYEPVPREPGGPE